MGTDLFKIVVTAAAVALCANWTANLAAPQGLPEGLPPERVEPSTALQAPDSRHAPNLVPVAIYDDIDSGAAQTGDSSSDHGDVRRAYEIAAVSQYGEETVIQYDDGAGTQYGEETVPSAGPEATDPRDDTSRASASKAVDDVDNDGDKDSDDAELVDQDDNGVVSAEEVSALRTGERAAVDAAKRVFAAAAGGTLPEEDAYGEARSEARQAAEAEGVDQRAAEFLAKDAADQAVLEKILEGLPEGSLAFAAPKEMQMGSSATVELLLSPSASVEGLKQMIEEGGRRYGAQIRMASDMEANLEGTNFQIDPVTPEIQGVSSTEPTAWRWQIRPTQAGSQHLQLALNALLAIEQDGEPVNHQIETFERSIKVQVTLNQRATSFLAGNWQFLWTALLVPVAVLLWNRYKRSRADSDAG